MTIVDGAEVKNIRLGSCPKKCVNRKGERLGFIGESHTQLPLQSGVPMDVSLYAVWLQLYPILSRTSSYSFEVFFLFLKKKDKKKKEIWVRHNCLNRYWHYSACYCRKKNKNVRDERTEKKKGGTAMKMKRAQKIGGGEPGGVREACGEIHSEMWALPPPELCM